MRSTTWMFVVAALIAPAACSSNAGDGSPRSVRDAQGAAAKALATLPKLVTEKNYKALGFDSVDEVGRAALAEPMAVYQIGLDRLRSYRAGEDVNGLLVPTAETIYPVVVDGQARSSVTIIKNASGYIVGGFGNAETARGLVRYRGARIADSFAVHVPLVGLYFLGIRTENRMTLTPVVESGRLPFRVGVPVPANEVVEAIVPLLAHYNGLPL